MAKRAARAANRFFTTLSLDRLLSRTKSNPARHQRRDDDSNAEDPNLTEEFKEWQRGLQEQRASELHECIKQSKQATQETSEDPDLTDKLKEWQTGLQEQRDQQLDEFIRKSDQATQETSELPKAVEHLDPAIIEAYISALRDGKEKQNNIRVMVVGYGGVGKTSLVRNLLGLTLIEPESTDGIDVHNHRCSEHDDWSNRQDQPGKKGIERIANIHKDISSLKKNKKQNQLSHRNFSKLFQKQTDYPIDEGLADCKTKVNLPRLSAINQSTTFNKLKDGFVKTSKKTLPSEKLLKSRVKSDGHVRYLTDQFEKYSERTHTTPQSVKAILVNRNTIITKAEKLGPTRDLEKQYIHSHRDDPKQTEFPINARRSDYNTKVNFTQPSTIKQLPTFNKFKDVCVKNSDKTLSRKKQLRRRTKSENDAVYQTDQIEKHGKHTKIAQRNIQAFSEEINKITTKAEKCVQIWDFGGQFVYYATHQLFHSRQAVYILVLDASKYLDDIVKDDEFPEGSKATNVKSFCKFWLQSIHSFVGDENGDPPVILVATHTDKVKDWDEEKETQFFENIESLFNGTPLENHIQSEHFAINNKEMNSVSIQKLRNYIVNTAETRESWAHEIPAKWIPLENCLIQRKQDKCIAFEEVVRLDSMNEIPIGSSNQIKMFLTYHHVMGNLIYFNDDGLRDLVVIDPQWIIDAFRCLITSKMYCRSRDKLSPEWRKLVQEALLSDVLIHEVWQADTSNNFLKYKEQLLLYLNKLGIISNLIEIDIEKSVEKNLNKYIVPSLMKGQEKKHEIEHFLLGRKGTATTLVFSFKNKFVPPTLFHRVTALALGKWRVLVYDGRRLLFENLGVYEIDETHAGLVEQFDKTIEIRVVNLSNEDVDCNQSDKFRRYVKVVIERECSRFLPQQSKSYTLGLRCNFNNIHGKAVKEFDELINVNTKRVPCPDRIQGHEIDMNLLKEEWQFGIKSIRPIWSKTKKGVNSYLKLDAGLNLSRKVSERDLSKIAEALGKNWEMLGVEIGLSEVKIQHIKMDNPFSTSVQIFTMLKTWMNKNSEKATMDTLIKHISSVKHLTVDVDEINNMLEGLF